MFGSILNESNYTEWSDIDLTSLGIPANRFYAAVAAVTDLSPSIKVDLIVLESCRPSLRDAILMDGVEL